MIIQPKIRGFICTTAHPAGCAQNVQNQIDYALSFEKKLVNPPKKVLVIGASTGYGLASRIMAAFAGKAQTLGVFFERPAEGNRPATAGWYNTAAFEKQAHAAGLYAKSLNGDAFSDELKDLTLETIQRDWQGEVDLVVYSLASPKRVDPQTGQTYASVLKTIGEPFTDKNLDVFNAVVNSTRIEPATDMEIENTIKVMGGEDWERWIHALLDGGCLKRGVKTVAYHYIGPKLTYPIYHQGTIGRAKAHLEKTAKILETTLQQSVGGHAYISVNKALVTQASSAIPMVPLYLTLLYKVMKAKGLHEGCIQQIGRLFSQRLYTGQPIPVDTAGLIRLDDWEMREDVQAEVTELWKQVNTENVKTLSDLAGYQQEFQSLFGFAVSPIDYQQEVSLEVSIPSLEEAPTA